MEHNPLKRCCRCHSVCLKTNFNENSKFKAGFHSQC